MQFVRKRREFACDRQEPSEFWIKCRFADEAGKVDANRRRHGVEYRERGTPRRLTHKLVIGFRDEVGAAMGTLQIAPEGWLDTPYNRRRRT
jgi:hypothetical protein